MNKSWFYLGLIGLALLTTSCGENKPPTPVASPPAATSPVAAVPAAKPVATPATAPATVKAGAVKTPAVPGKSPVAVKPVSVDVAAGLIPPTDGESWAKTVAKGRPDPFGMLSLQPIEVIEPIDPLGQKALSQQPSAKIATTNTGATKPSGLPTVKVAAVSPMTTKITGKQKIASNGKNQTVAISAIPRSGVNKAVPKIIVALREPVIAKGKTTPKVATNSKIIAAKPVLTKQKAAGTTDLPGKTQIAAKPEKIAEKPLQALAVEISGVIEVAGKTQVIIKLPAESFSRYIEVGDRIADGKVLVKRVEGQNGLSPTVVLEEVGVEVPRKIGDRISEPAAPAAAPAAEVPAVAPAPTR